MLSSIIYRSPLVGDASPRLLILFSGWGSDPAPFSGLAAPGYDILLVWDYTDIPQDGEWADLRGFGEGVLEGYAEICVMAWSFGVPVADRFVSAMDNLLPITLTLAVNGTLHPVHDQFGIPRAIFDGTLKGLSDRTLYKFRRRMLGSAEALASYLMSAPDRSIDSLKYELRSIDALGDTCAARWDIACIASDDLIIPPHNQHAAWRLTPSTRIVEITSSHYPDFQTVINRFLADKSLVGLRFSAAADTYERSASAQRAVTDYLADLTDGEHAISGREVLEIGSGTGFLTRALLSRGTPASLRTWDLVDTPPAVNAVYVQHCRCDAEITLRTLPDASVDTIISASTVQWFNSLPKFIFTAGRVLRPGGHLIFATYAPDNLEALTAITSRKLDTPSLDAIRTFIPEGMQLKVAEEQTIEACFPDVLTMLRHLKETGVNAVSRGSVTDIHRICSDYPRINEGSEKVMLEYRPVFIVIQRMHED